MLKTLAVSAIIATSALTPVRAEAATTIPFASWQLQEPGSGQWWADAIAAFEEANPDIDIEEVYIPFADYLPQMTVRFAANRPPAVIQLSEQMFGSFAQQGWFAGLDDHIKGTDIETEWAPAQAGLDWDGESRGVLLSNSPMMLFYNKDLLAEAGVDVPTSFAEFKAAVGEMTDRDAGRFGLSAVTTEHPTAVEELHRYTKWAGTSLVKDGAYNLTSPEVVDALESYRQTVSTNAPLGNNSSVARQLFIDGRTSFLIDGPWVWNWLERATPEMRPQLVMDRAPFDPQIGPGGLTMHVAAGLSDEQENAAWEFVQFVMQPEWQKRFVIATGQPAGRATSVLDEAAAAEYPHLGVTSEAAGEAEPMFPKNKAIQANFAKYSSILMEAALRLLSTDDPTEEIMADAQAQLETSVPLN